MWHLTDVLDIKTIFLRQHASRIARLGSDLDVAMEVVNYTRLFTNAGCRELIEKAMICARDRFTVEPCCISCAAGAYCFPLCRRFVLVDAHMGEVRDHSGVAANR